MGNGNFDKALKELTAAVGKENILTKKVDLFCYSYSSALTGELPTAVVFIGSTAEASAVMKILSRYDIVAIPRGAGSNLCGGTLPVAGAVILETAKMDKILRIDIANRYVEVEAGVFNTVIQNELKPYGYFFGPDPASMDFSTVGGNVAENAGGMRCVKYGVTADNVIGMEVVLADGQVVVSHGPLADNIGYDLTGIMHGSEGAFGLITRLWLRINKLPEALKTLLTTFPKVESAARTVSDIIAQGIIPRTLEMIDKPILLAVTEFKNVVYPPDAEAVLLIEVDGFAEDIEPQVRRITEICEKNGVSSIEIAANDAEREYMWTGRLTGAGCLCLKKPALAQEDITVPRTLLPEVIAEIQAIAAKHSLLIGHVCHMGDGNFHPTIVYDDKDEDETKRVHIAFEEIMHAAISRGGTISGEHGVGIEKLRGMEMMFKPWELAYMHTLKNAFDPQGILNPGKAVPFLRGEEGEPSAGKISRVAEDKEDALAIIRAECPSLELMHDDETMQKYTYRGNKPWFVAKPSAQGEVAKVVSWAVNHGYTLVPIGNGSKAADEVGTSAFDGAVDLSALTKIIEIDTGNLTVTTETGVNLAALQEALNAHGLFLPVDCIEAAEPTLGGLVAANALGGLQLRYKAWKNIVSGLRFVNAQGEEICHGGKNIKDVAGFDLNKLMIGTRGTLGIITELTLKVQPLPEAVVCRTYKSEDLAEFIAFAAAVQEAAVEPLRFDAAITGGCCYAYICLGGMASALKRQTELLDSVERNTVKRIKETNERKQIFGREFVAEYLPSGLRNGITVQSAMVFTAVHAWIEAMSKLAAAQQTTLFGHITTGVMYACCEVENEQGEQAYNDVREQIAKFSAQEPNSVHRITEHIGLNAQATQPSDIVDAMIKKSLDPHAVFNPGRIGGKE